MAQRADHGHDEYLTLLLEKHEERIGRLEGRVDKLYDPETGLYPTVQALRGDLDRDMITLRADLAKAYVRVLVAILVTAGSVISSLVIIILTHAGN